MARDWNKTFTFVMDRRVTIEVWEVGLVHLSLIHISEPTRPY